MKKAFFIVFIAIFWFLYFAGAPAPILNQPEPELDEQKIAIEEIVPDVQNSGTALQEVKKGSTTTSPPPLIVGMEESDPPLLIAAVLTREGIMGWTNSFRLAEGVGLLAPSTVLNTIAEFKARDILERQYFEHTAPTGEGISQVAQQFGYMFVVVGENLALGNFASDEDMVRAWMASTGHRANIVKAQYQEIGIGIVSGIFNNREVWVGVQVFAVPRAACGYPDVALARRIESYQHDAVTTKKHIETLRTVIEKEQYTTYDEYESLVVEHNRFIEIYNTIVESNKKLIDEHNATVSSFNACVEKFTS